MVVAYPPSPYHSLIAAIVVSHDASAATAVVPCNASTPAAIVTMVAAVTAVVGDAAVVPAPADVAASSCAASVVIVGIDSALVGHSAREEGSLPFVPSLTPTAIH